MNPSPKNTPFASNNVPVFDASLNDRLTEATGRVRGTVTRMLRRYPHDVDDVLQNACLKAFLQTGKFRGDAQFNTWFYKIAVTEALMHLRSRRRKTYNTQSLTADPEAEEKQLIDILACSALGPEQQLIKAERCEILIDMVRHLPPKLRQETLSVIFKDRESAIRKTTTQKARFFRAKIQLRRMCQMSFTRGLFQLQEEAK